MAILIKAPSVLFWCAHYHHTKAIRWKLGQSVMICSCHQQGKWKRYFQIIPKNFISSYLGSGKNGEPIFPLILFYQLHIPAFDGQPEPPLIFKTIITITITIIISTAMVIIIISMTIAIITCTVANTTLLSLYHPEISEIRQSWLVNTTDSTIIIDYICTSVFLIPSHNNLSQSHQLCIWQPYSLLSFQKSFCLLFS